MTPARRQRWLVMAALGLLLPFARPAFAETAVSLDSFGNSNNLDYVVGYRFQTYAPVTITDLGKFDIEGDGLNGAAQVGIWDLSQSLLVSTTVPTGTGGVAETAGNYTAYFQPVSPITLSAGTYVIGTQTFVSETNTYAATIAVPTGVRYLAGQYKTGTTFGYPVTGAASSGGYFGANFKFEYAGEPISVASYSYDGSGQGAAPNVTFPDSSGVKLTDGVVPTSDFQDTGWVGFRDDSPDDASSQPQITFDFGSSYDLTSAELVYLNSATQASGTITTPEEILVSVSDDGVTFGQPRSILAANLYSGTTTDTKVSLLDLEGLTGRYARLDFRQTSTWTFLGETAFRGNIAVVPEPASLTLTGLAAVCCSAFVAFRRRACTRKVA